MATKTLQFNCHDQERQPWLDRAVRCVRMLEEVQASIARPPILSDVGCGDMKLGQYLRDAGLEVDYRPYDLVPQSDDVRKLDIRTDLPDAGSDVVTLLGVLEYVADPKLVLSKLAGVTRYLVVSYVPSDFSTYTQQQLERLGWRHHYSEQEFARILEQSGFRIDRSEATANGRTILWLAHSLKTA